MKALTNLRHMSNDQLNNRLIQIRSTLMRARGFNHAGKDVIGLKGLKGKNDTMFIRRLKKDQARILTILGERRKRKEVGA